MPQPTVPNAPLLADHPFVRQLHATTPLEAGQMAGRVAHLVSRQATIFASLEALVAFMPRVLPSTWESYKEEISIRQYGH